jgi:polar amino acid transport system substrate-binding protein
MKTGLIYLLNISLLAIFAVSGCNDNNKSSETISVTGLELIPNCYLQDGEIVGMDVDIAKEAMQKAGLKMELSLSSSADEALNTTLAGPNRALLTLGYSPERQDLFKWAGPTTQGMYGIFENGDSGIKYPLDIDDAKLIKPIAAVRGWLETTTLEKLGFTNLKYYDSYDAALAAFMNGETKFIASDFFHLIKALPDGYFMANVYTVTRYLTVFNYIAFSKDVSDDVIEKVQKAINSLIEDQATVAILRSYFPTMPADYIPGTIQLFTEDAAPYNYGTGTGASRIVEGSSVDFVNEIQARTGFVNKTNLSTWADAYAIPQYLPNSAVYTTARTPERENMFQWVGPISCHKTNFYTLASSGITIDTLEQAKALQSIATPKGWFTEDFLVNNNFKNIVVTALTSQEAFQQLINGEVQALLLPEPDIKWLTENNGVAMSQLTQHIQAIDRDGYLAFSLNTPASTVEKWQSKLDDMKADGTFETIWNKWYEGEPMP